MTQIDYERAKREFPKLKAKLSKATKGKKPLPGEYVRPEEKKNLYDPKKVVAVVKEAYAAFDSWGAFPDDWRLFANALQDARNYARRCRIDLDLSAFTPDLDGLAFVPPAPQPQPLPERILWSIRQHLDLEYNDASKDAEINAMTFREALRHYLEFEGIIGYTEAIVALAKCFGATDSRQNA